VTPERKDHGVAGESRGELVMIVFEVSVMQEEEAAQHYVAQTSELLTPVT